VIYRLSGSTFVEGEKEQEGTTGVLVSGSRQAKKEFMSVDIDPQIPSGVFDPFAEANDGESADDYVHVRVQQRNGRKSWTTVQGLKKEFNYNKILKDFKKEFCCNGSIIKDPELGQVIQLQGDQRKNVATFLVMAGVVRKDLIKMHGF
jgi:translation initiation factor 1